MTARDRARLVLVGFFEDFEDDDALCRNWADSILADFDYLGIELSLDPGVDMPLGDMCRPVNQSRGYRPSTHRIRTTLAKGVYL